MTYAPEYVPGKIIVCFKDELNLDCEQLSAYIGCKYVGYVKPYGDVFAVPIGREEEFINIFSIKYNDIIQYIDLYDAKLKSRKDSTKRLDTMVDALYQTDGDDEEYKLVIDEIIKYATNMRKEL